MKKKGASEEKKVFIRTVRGCVRRNLDAKKIGEYLKENKFTIIDTPKEADYIIFFSCGVTNLMTDNCLKDIKHFQKFNGELIVAGCIPDIAPQRLGPVFSGKTISPKDLSKIEEYFPQNKVKLNEIPEQHSKWLTISHTEGIGTQLESLKKIIEKIPFSHELYHYLSNHILNSFFSETILRFTPKNRGYIISISQGCIHRCTYCGIWRGVGPLISKPLQQVVTEFKEGMEKGHTKFILSADDIGPYGFDIGCSLPELLNEITKIEGNYKLTIAGTHPAWIIKYIDDLVPIIKRKKITSLLLAIQSGNDRVLRLMHRSYNRKALISTVTQLKKADPNMKIDVQCIVGFPSETRREFMDTIKLIDKVQFDSGHIFTYIPVDDTEATKISPQISMQEKRQRSRIAVKDLQNLGFSAVYDRAFKCLAFNNIEKNNCEVPPSEFEPLTY